MTDVVVRLPDEAQTFVAERVASGEFATAGDYLLSLIESARRQAIVDRVDQLLLQGLDSGPGIEVTPDFWTKKREVWERARSGEAPE